MAKPSKDKKKSKSSIDQTSKARPAGTSPTSAKVKKAAAGKGGLRTAKRKKAPEPKGMDLSRLRAENSPSISGRSRAGRFVKTLSGETIVEYDQKTLEGALRSWLDASQRMLDEFEYLPREHLEKFIEKVDFSDPKKLTTKYGPIIAKLAFYRSEHLQKTRDMLLPLFNEAAARDEEQTAKFLQEHKDLLNPFEKALLGMEEETPKVQDQKAVVKTKTMVKAKAKVKGTSINYPGNLGFSKMLRFGII